MNRAIALGSALGAAFALYERAYWSAAAFALVTSVALVSMKSSSKPPSPPRSLREIGRSKSAPALLGEGVQKEAPIIQPVLLSEASSSSLLLEKEVTSPAQSLSESLVRLDSLPRLKLHWLSSFSSRSSIIDLRSSPPLQIDWDGHFGTQPLSLEIGDVWGPTSLPVQLFMTSSPEMARWASEQKMGNRMIFLADSWRQNFLPTGRLRRIFIQVSEKSALSPDGTMPGTSPLFPGSVAGFARALQPGGELRFVSATPDFLERCKERLAQSQSMDKELFPLQSEFLKVTSFRIREKSFWSTTTTFSDHLHLVYTRAT